MQLIDKQSTINLLKLKLLEKKSISQWYLYNGDDLFDDINIQDEIIKEKAKITLLSDLERVIPEFINELEVIYDTNKID